MPELKFNKEGVYSLLLTPFNEDRSIDFDIYEKYVDWQVAQGSHHLFSVCGSSEMARIELADRVKLAQLAVKNAGGTPVFATANLEPGWYAQLEEIKKMENIGVDGLVFVTKGYGNDGERLYSYLTELASHTELPILLYEFPGTSPHLMPAEIYGRVAATGKFIGIKDTTCQMDMIKAKIAVKHDTAVLQANIPYLMEAYLAGAQGVVATPTTCGAKLFVRMWDSFIKGDLENANLAHQHICLLDDALNGGFTATAKYLVSLQGIPMNWCTRGTENLNAQRLKALRVYYDWAKANDAI